MASHASHKKLHIPHIKIGNEMIAIGNEVKNIGFIFDSVMNSKKQVNQICKGAWFHLCWIAQLNTYLDEKST